MAKSNFKNPKAGDKKDSRLSQELRGYDLECILIVPVDVAKKEHKALTADYYGKIYNTPFPFSNNRPGLDGFISIVDETARKIKAKKIVVAMEPTGHYHEPICRALVDMLYDVRLVNSYSVAIQRKGDLTWCKSDNDDLNAIGQVVINNRSLRYAATPAVYENLRQVVRARNQDVKTRNALKCHIKATCDCLFPGLSASDIFSDFWSGPVFAVINKYPTPHQILRLGKFRLKIFLKNKGLRPKKEAVDRLIQLAREALAPCEADTKFLTLVLEAQLAHYRLLCDNIHAWEIHTAQLLAVTPGILLLSIPYISVTTAAEYIAELGPHSAYRRAKSIIRRAGLNPGYLQSGQWEAPRTPITKQGSAPLRAAIMKIAANIAAENPYYNACYDRLVGNEKNEKKKKGKRKNALVIIATHFVKHSFSMMRYGKLFAPERWSGPALTDDPLQKIGRYLEDRNARQHIEVACLSAAEHVPRSAPAEMKQSRCKAASVEAGVHVRDIIADIRTRLDANRAVAQLSE